MHAKFHSSHSRRSGLSLLLGLIGALSTAALLQGQTEPAQPDPTPVSETEPVTLSAFEVKAAKDRGYRASNSVSATRIDIPIRDLPLTVDVFTEQFIHDLQANDLLDIVKFAPGVSSNSGDFAGGNNGNYNIRGFASGNPLRNGFKGPNVLDPVTISRVEVVRGPSSLLYGTLPPGGLVNYITKRPLDKAEAMLTGRIGSDNYYRAEVDTTGPIPSSSDLLYRFTAAYTNAQQFNDPSEGKTKVFAPVLQWRTPHSVLTLDYQYFHRVESPPIFMAPFFVTPGFQFLQKVPGLPKDFSAMGNQDHRESDTRAFVADWAFKVGDWDFHADYSLARQSISHFLTATLFIFNTQIAHPFLNRTASLQTIASDDQTGQFEVVRSFKFNKGEFKFLAGYQAERRKENFQMQAIPSAIAPPAWDLLDPTTWNRTVRFDLSQLSVVNDPSRIITDSDGVYAVGHLALFDNRLGLLAGLRHSTVKSISYNERTNTVIGVPIDQDQTSPQVGVIVKLLPELSAYASYSESFVPTGGVKIVNGVAVGPFDPTVGKGYDAGLKADFMDGRISATLAFFKVENTGIVNNTLVGTDPITGLPVFTTFQSGVQASKGVEFSAVFSPDDHFQVMVSYSNLDAYVKTNLANPAQVGFQLSNTARDYFNVWARYNFVAGGNSGFYVAGGANYTGKRLVDLSNQALYWDPLTLITVSTGYTFRLERSTVTLDLACKNLSDKVYYPTNNTRGQPRTFIASASVKF